MIFTMGLPIIVWFHEIRPHLCRIPWFCVRPCRLLIFLCGYRHSEREKWHEQAVYNSWSNAFDPKRFYKKKVSKRLSYFHHLSKKVGPKVTYFYCGNAYRDWPQIRDPQIRTVGNPIETKEKRLLGQLFFEVRGSNSIVLLLSIRIFPSDQKHSTRNCIKSLGGKYLVAIVNSREMKWRVLQLWHRIKEFDQ